MESRSWQPYTAVLQITVLMYFYKAHPLARPVPEASGVECEVCISLSGSGQKATQRERERKRKRQKAKGFALARGPPLLYTFYEKSETGRSLCTIIRKQPNVEFCLSRSFDKLFWETRYINLITDNWKNISKYWVLISTWFGLLLLNWIYTYIGIY